MFNWHAILLIDSFPLFKNIRERYWTEKESHLSYRLLLNNKKSGSTRFEFNVPTFQNLVISFPHQDRLSSGMVGLATKWVRLALKSDLKKPRICPIWGQSDPFWSQTYHP